MGSVSQCAAQLDNTEPAPERCRKTTWKEFLRRHWTQIIAADFFSIEVWTCAGLKRFMVLFFIDLSSRRVEIGGIGRSPNRLWMAQVARNVTDAVDGFFSDKRYLIHDRDPLYTREFIDIIASSGIEAVKLPARSPNLNAYAERFVRTIKETTESNAMLRHRHDPVRRFPSRSSDTSIVKENDLMIRREAVRDRRIPAIHVGVEVLQKEQRNRSRLTKTTAD